VQGEWVDGTLLCVCVCVCAFVSHTSVAVQSYANTTFLAKSPPNNEAISGGGVCACVCMCVCVCVCVVCEGVRRSDVIALRSVE